MLGALNSPICLHTHQKSIECTSNINMINVHTQDIVWRVVKIIGITPSNVLDLAEWGNSISMTVDIQVIYRSLSVITGDIYRSLSLSLSCKEKNQQNQQSQQIQRDQDSWPSFFDLQHQCTQGGESLHLQPLTAGCHCSLQLQQLCWQRGHSH